jgi:hypothetical protein
MMNAGKIPAAKKSFVCPQMRMSKSPCARQHLVQLRRNPIPHSRLQTAEAERMSKVIRQALIDVLPLEQVRDQCRIIYGGSVNADNIKEFLDFKLIDGVLVGNASLNEEEFYSLIKAAQ